MLGGGWGGALRTAYPFCCGSRHHSYQPNGPCWLIRMFHPKWGLIQSTVSPWGREWAVREQILSIIYSDKLSLGRALGVPVEAWGMRYLIQLDESGHSHVEEQNLTRKWKTFTRHVANHLLSLSLSFHICKMKRLTHQRFSNDLHRSPRALLLKLGSVYVGHLRGLLKMQSLGPHPRPTES